MAEDQQNDPYQGVAPLLDLATQWLARSAAGNAPLELAAHDLRWRGDWRLSICRTGTEIEGISVVMPGDHWLIEATSPLAASSLANAAVIHDRRPTTLTTSQRAAEWLRPLLTEHGAIAGERTLRILTCTKPTSDEGGRWATSADLSALAAYERQIEAEQRKHIDRSWAGLVARKELAIAVADDGIVATIRRYGRAPSSAGIADLYVVPRARRSHVGSHLAGFVANDLLSHRKTVYAAIDDSDAPSLALHAAVGFVPAGTCYRALLK
jgi:hypothetical protein